MTLELSHLIILAILGFGGYYLVQAVKLKENALRAVENYCEQAGVQLLDATVFLRRLGLGRDQSGRLQIKREFQFEFTATGGERNKGWIQIIGRRIVFIELAPHRFH